ncbi:5'/3'-nucleotidase SurE [Halovenus sp. WSH3]|uniref:5'-nucleotidase SurE n=1 Tax=Halovenus carboxidivorans TaxID=2692199 RepID=A0A6B0TAI3_9EURY|nr:5'/3'-nucleotidase SurE [Halovenus carboxidivorans]MXR52251.1 5'/3'-nucleotidase SurE [Halovenus carboxidivorans]
MDDLDILVTNDDGIDSLGFHALYDGLSEIGSVTAVAPADDQSAVGRTVSQTVTVREHDLGYVIEGTPVDCVVAGLSSLCPETDLVVAGCNQGANMGAAVLGRSGTVSAAVEAAFHGVPGIATSLYVPSPEWEKASEIPSESYAAAVDATRYLADRAFEAGLFEVADYLNINAPTTDICTGEMEITRPSHVYELSSRQDGDQIDLVNPIWEKLADGDIPDPEGTDRRAIVENRISVSPLTAPHTTERTEVLADLAAEYSLQ